MCSKDLARTGNQIRV
ncbi:hypothetical protein F383_16122 [Gossypium arboreum]|uniref:Uncharacterized protein n=1 Tax=Gossypium arboreum TaxID=29729 RepID=A0A0B0PS06_GOSAR|nr:hypothetical protein F383_16122 [Gossypium arboreum]